MFAFKTAALEAASDRVRWSTRLVFLVAGFCTAAWAPLTPLAKARLGIEDGALGGLLLFLGLGSILAMPLTGLLTARIGCRNVILGAGALLVCVLPSLALAESWLGLALALAVFGAAVGTIDVAMNLQAVIVERQSGRSLMSGFHGMYSLGGVLGAGGVSLLLGLGWDPLSAVLATSAAAAALIALSAPGLLPYGDDGERAPFFVLPKGAILFIGLLCLLTFLAEGAVLDWSAVFLTSALGAEASLAGLGYACFAVAMTIGRLTGDGIRARLGGERTLLIGGVITAAGFLTTLLAPTPSIGLAGFFLVGAGASNIVPVLFSAAGADRTTAPALAVASVTTLGYLGVLAGPAAIGFVAHASSLSFAFALLAAAMVFVGLNARILRR